MKPFARAREVSLEVELKNLDLPFYFAYVPGPVPVSIDSGQLSVTAGVTYRVSQDAKPELYVAGKLGLADLSLRDRTGEPLVSLKQGSLGISKAGHPGSGIRPFLSFRRRAGSIPHPGREGGMEH